MGGEGKLDFGLRTWLIFNGKEHHMNGSARNGEVINQIPFCMHTFGFLHEKGCLAPVLARLTFCVGRIIVLTSPSIGLSELFIRPKVELNDAFPAVLFHILC